MKALSLHHLGLVVEDLPRARASLERHGFAGDPAFDVSGAQAAIGNGLDAIDMTVAFLVNESGVLELIQHRAPFPGVAPGPADPGTQTWSILSAGDQPLTLPGVVLTYRGTELTVGMLSRDPAATVDLLQFLGVDSAPDGALSLAGTTITVRQAGTSAVPPRPDVVGRSHLAIRVEDAHQAHAELVDRGFACVSNPIPHEGVIHWFFVRDPGGSGEIEVIEDHS
jgi:hypothetical protein